MAIEGTSLFSTAAEAKCAALERTLAVMANRFTGAKFSVCRQELVNDPKLASLLPEIGTSLQQYRFIYTLLSGRERIFGVNIYCLPSSKEGEEVLEDEEMWTYLIEDNGPLGPNLLYPL